MKKSLLILIIVAFTFIFTGCTKVVPIKQTEIAVHIDGGSNKWNDFIFSGNNIKLSSLCSRNCDDAHIFESHHQIKNIVANYAMPQSNDLDLTLGLSIKVTYNRHGGKNALMTRLKESVTRYQYFVSGSASDNQIFRTSLSTIIDIDLSEAQVKSKVRPILEPFDLTKAYYNIAKGGSIVTDIHASLDKHLKNINSPLIILSVEIAKIAQPEAILNKKREEEQLASKERIHKKQLDMREARMQREQLIKLKESANELELLSINAPFMTPEVLAYKWIQVADKFAENGLPFATTPEMLLPSISKLTSMSVDPRLATIKLKERISDIEKSLKKDAQCSENDC